VTGALSTDERAVDPDVGARPPSFEEVYEVHLAFVWRSAGRLGVPEASLEDVAQDVFVVVHRRLSDYDGRAPLASWLFGIVARVVREHRRRFQRKTAPWVAFDEGRESGSPIAAASASTPHAAAERSEAVRLLYTLLDELDDDKREVLVLSQLEEMSVPEIAACLGLNANTTAARLRAARQAFAEAHGRHLARSAGQSAVRASRRAREGRRP
jgi:RNA polymerase sigma-70 factor (ECF subfamily)